MIHVIEHQNLSEMKYNMIVETPIPKLYVLSYKLVPTSSPYPNFHYPKFFILVQSLDFK